MPAYTLPPAPTTPTYTTITAPGRAIFNDPNVIFNDPITQFDGGTTNYTLPNAPTSPTYTLAPNPS